MQQVCCEYKSARATVSEPRSLYTNVFMAARRFSLSACNNLLLGLFLWRVVSFFSYCACLADRSRCGRSERRAQHPPESRALSTLALRMEKVFLLTSQREKRLFLISPPASSTLFSPCPLRLLSFIAGAHLYPLSVGSGMKFSVGFVNLCSNLLAPHADISKAGREKFHHSMFLLKNIRKYLDIYLDALDFLFLT